MTVKQLSVFAQNKPGRLSALTGILAQNGVNIRAVSVADTSDFGILRLIVSDIEKAKAALKDSAVVSESNVLAVIAEDKPGGMARMMETLYKANISVEYMYSAFLNPSESSACLILRVDNNENAVAALTEGGFKLLSQEDMAKI
ncbi:ACT domain-containing protein [Ruminococcus sp. NK3A76]|uniref:ACT domain-containing protein n=1 Tax=Ruminococcus sp. NK3A76 TaxID=877411 RepID=UPI0004920B12|nr:ACT domain-containing protein [Ruminococcus sp. NK3A76]